MSAQGCHANVTAWYEQKCCCCMKEIRWFLQKGVRKEEGGSPVEVCVVCGGSGMGRITETTGNTNLLPPERQSAANRDVDGGEIVRFCRTDGMQKTKGTMVMEGVQRKKKGCGMLEKAAATWHVYR